MKNIWNGLRLAWQGVDEDVRGLLGEPATYGGRVLVLVFVLVSSFVCLCLSDRKKCWMSSYYFETIAATPAEELSDPIRSP